MVYICPKGYIPLGDFNKILPGGGKFHRSNFKKLWPCSTKTRQKFASGEKFWGSIRKLEHRCTTTNLPLCNDTIIVLKIILLPSVSVITNFVIPKRDKKITKNEKKTSHFFVYSRRATHDPHHTWHGDRGGPSHFCTPLTSNFF